MDNSIDQISRLLAARSTRRRAFKLIGGGIVGGVVAAKGLTIAAAKPPQATGLSTPITGTIADGGGAFAGVFEITRFASSGGGLTAIGTLTGTLTDALGNVIGTVTQTITLPVTASGTCEILSLVLGPLDLELLGLQVHLDQVVLEITAESGPGNLLGNLLCGIAGLLDSGATGSALARLLNQLLGLLG